MGQLEDLRAFVRIVEQGSIGKAAEQEGIAKSAMSRKLRLLEEKVQAVLIARTTRQWALTEAGREYYERGLGVLSAFDEFDAHIRNDSLDVEGEIKISVPLYFGKIRLNEYLLDFAERHPKVHLTIDFSDRIVDVIDEHFDLVIRISDMDDSSLIARKLGETKHIFCASPSYLSNSTLSTPDDLKEHRIIQFGATKRPKWAFNSSSGKPLNVALTADLNSHDGSFLIEAAERGLGIIRVPDFLAEESLKNKRLVPILDNFTQPAKGIYIVYPTSRFLPHRVRSLMSYLLESIR